MEIPKEKNRGIWAWDLVKLIVLFSIVLFASFYLFMGFKEESTRLAIRWSARISVTSFCLAFGASSIHHFIKNSLSFWILMNRKYLGISFAIIHGMHLFFLVILQIYFHPVFSLAATKSLLGGGLAYLFMALMFFTSFEYFANKLSSRSWKLLHTTGGYWIWIIFARSYWKNVLFNEGYEYLPLAIFLVLILVLRILKLLAKQKSSS